MNVRDANIQSVTAAQRAQVCETLRSSVCKAVHSTCPPSWQTRAHLLHLTFTVTGLANHADPRVLQTLVRTLLPSLPEWQSLCVLVPGRESGSAPACSVRLST